MLHAILHWLSIHTGTSVKPSPSVFYNFWSGFGSDLGEAAILVGMVHFARHANCGVKGCWQFSRHEYDMDGVKHKLCRKHHPHVDGPVTAAQVAAHHADVTWNRLIEGHE